MYTDENKFCPYCGTPKLTQTSNESGITPSAPQQDTTVSSSVTDAVSSIVTTFRESGQESISTDSGLTRTIAIAILACGSVLLILLFFPWVSSSAGKSISGWSFLTDSDGNKINLITTAYTLCLAIGTIALFGYLNFKWLEIRKSFIYLALGGYVLEAILVIIMISSAGGAMFSSIEGAGRDYSGSYSYAQDAVIKIGATFWVYVIVLISVLVVVGSVLLLRNLRAE
jgi:hypothetical protein